VGGDTNFKFGRLVGRSKCCHKDGKTSLKGASSGHVNRLNFWGTNYISGMAKASVITFCVQVGYVKSQHKNDKSSLKGKVKLK